MEGVFVVPGRLGHQKRAYSANEDTCHGFSRVPNRVYDSVLPMIASRPGSSLWLLSTPNCRTGFFYDVWSRQDPQRAFHAMRRDAPREDSAVRDTWLESVVTTAPSVSATRRLTFLPREISRCRPRPARGLRRDLGHRA